MNMTSEQVKGERFATVRRDGYDPAAVDRVLDGLEQEARDLAAKCTGLEQSDTAMRATLVTANERVRLLEEELARALDAAREPAPAETPAPVVEDPVRAASQSVARLLETCTRDADNIVAEAHEEAGRVVAHARAEAAQTIQAGLAELHAREEALDATAEEQREQLDRMRSETLRELEGRRDKVDAEVRRLSELGGQLRTELVSYFHEQLEVLERPSFAGTDVGADIVKSRAS
jgi:cell division septum initiation protein DivIVA